MKHNWEYKRLGDVCKIVNGFAFKSELFKDSGMPILRIANIQNDTITTDALVFCNPSDYKTDLSKFLVKSDDLVMALSGATTGKIGINKTNIEFYLNQRVALFKDILISRRYLFYFLKTEGKNILESAFGVAQPNVSTSKLTELYIPVPTQNVQEQIVAELDKINETIEDCRELLRNLDALAQSLFNDYFGDPAINPKGWRIYKIKDICSVNPTKREIRIPTSSEISFLPMEDLPINARYFTPIKVKTLNEVQNSYTYFSGEDVLFAKVTPCFENGKAGIPVNLINNIGFGSSELFVLRPNFQIINREYIYSFIQTNHFVSEAIKKLSGTSGLRRVPRTVVENFQIPVPPLELQEKFAARMEEIEAQKKIVESTIAELQTLLDSRMDYWFN